MNMLIDLLPKTVEIDNKEYDINWDFRTSILFEIMMQDEELTEEEKIVQALRLYYPVIPTNIEKAIEKFLWFYKCGKKDRKVKGNKSIDNGVKQIYSFDYDDEYIYSAFIDQYKIDLQDIEGFHWWKFKAMFKGLKSDNEIVKIMGYRSMTIDKKMTQEEKDFYSKMKRLYEIPISESEQEKLDAITKALMSDGDLSKVL